MGVNKNRELFEDYPVAKAVRTMAVPSIIGQIIILIYNIADTFFIGRTNNPLMVAGASLILPVFNISLVFGNMSGVGGGALISALLGEGRQDEAKKVCSFSIYFGLLLAAAFSLGVLVFMKPLVTALGGRGETMKYASAYATCVIVLGGIPTILSNVFSNLVRSVGESGKAGFGVTMGGVLNILLDPLFMFVLLPRGNEIMGAGIATCLSNCISCVYFIVVIKKLGRTTVLTLRPSRSLPERSSIRRLFSVGIPSAVNSLLFDLDYVIIDRLMSGYSDTALAAVGIVLKAERLPTNVGVGLCQGMVPIVAYNYSAKNYSRARDISRFSLMVGVVFGVAAITLYEIFAPYIMRFFISDAQTVALGTSFLRFRAISTVMMFMCFYHVHLFNSYGKGKISLALGVTRWAVFNIPLLFILNALFGMYGVVLGEFVGDLLTVIVSFIVHRRFQKKTAMMA